MHEMLLFFRQQTQQNRFLQITHSTSATLLSAWISFDFLLLYVLTFTTVHTPVIFENAYNLIWFNFSKIFFFCFPGERECLEFIFF